MPKIETRKIKLSVSREGELCPNWPRCHCIAQGYLNLSEQNNCGKKPKSRRIVHEEEVD